MPITLGANIRRLDQKEFAEIAYEVMGCAFQVHTDLGRLFDEKVYQRELAFRLPGARTGVPLRVSCDGFSKTYFLDLLVGDGGIFELKTADLLVPRHRGQLLNYLLLSDTAHGKVINFRTERVQHEFVNNTRRHAERVEFVVEDRRWEEIDGASLKERVIRALRDWGTGLDLALYEEVASYFCGRGEDPCRDVEVRADGRSLGVQPVRLAAPDVALRISGLAPEELPAMETHLRRLLEHTDLRAIQWINVDGRLVRFATVYGKKWG